MKMHIEMLNRQREGNAVPAVKILRLKLQACVDDERCEDHSKQDEFLIHCNSL